MRGAYLCGGSSVHRAYLWALLLAHHIEPGRAWIMARALGDYVVLHP